ncbi:MFS transporter [Streptomyces iconiensis]|uniref:MFS transporter n=1 Tax=Streptomyces iconiensis TaxID=1384038 RepID=A0ABT7A639_9ACTN|nr:MFS transporter [Streptomyces iconiensis]MDJ1136807.1 MFS transporter [Streptomyces iconiensis]
MFGVLLLPGALRAFLPALIGRSSLAMSGLALLLAVQDKTGSFAQGGLATAAFGIATVAGAPWRARAIDRFGQRRALTVMATGQATGFFALALLVDGRQDAAPWLLLVLSAEGGLTAPPLGAAMRMVWASLTQAGDQRKRAFSFDAVSEELLFLAGPVLISAVIGATSPGFGLGVTAATVFLGTVAMVSSPASGAMRGTRRDAVRRERVLRRPGFGRVLLVLLGAGAVLGAVEVVAPAVAAQHDAASAAGWLLAAFSAGSALGGLLYGRLNLKAGVGTRLFALSTGMGIATVSVSWITPLGLFAAGLVLVGLFLAPSLVTGYLIADAIAPEGSRTEASTWINTAINLGASLASAGAGIVIDRSGTGLALLLAGVVPLALALATPIARLRAIEAGEGRPVD